MAVETTAPATITTETTVSPLPARVVQDGLPNEYENWKKRRLGIVLGLTFAAVLIVACTAFTFLAQPSSVREASGIIIVIVTNAFVFGTAIYGSWIFGAVWEDKSRINAGYSVGASRYQPRPYGGGASSSGRAIE